MVRAAKPNICMAQIYIRKAWETYYAPAYHVMLLHIMSCISTPCGAYHVMHSHTM